MEIKFAKDFDIVYQFLLEEFGPAIASKLNSIPIVLMTNEDCKLNHFNGQGFALSKETYGGNERILEEAIKSDEHYQNILNRINPTVRDDFIKIFNCYVIHKYLGFIDAIVVNSSNTVSLPFTIVHELVHIVVLGDDNSIMKDFKAFIFNDEILDIPDEQFTRIKEMKLAKKMGMSFDQYFRNAWPLESVTIDEHELGKRRDDIRYPLAKQDYFDYQVLWDSIKGDVKKANWKDKFITQYASMKKMAYFLQPYKPPTFDPRDRVVLPAIRIGSNVYVAWTHDPEGPETCHATLMQHMAYPKFRNKMPEGKRISSEDASRIFALRGDVSEDGQIALGFFTEHKCFYTKGESEKTFGIATSDGINFKHRKPKVISPESSTGGNPYENAPTFDETNQQNNS